MRKKVVILGGGTINHVRSHLAICAPSYGQTAKELDNLVRSRIKSMSSNLVLTKMADTKSAIITNDDVSKYVQTVVEDLDTKVVIFNMAMCDFTGQIDQVESHKYAERLRTKDGKKFMRLAPSEKIISTIRKSRKDIFLVGFKTTSNATEAEQYAAGLELLKKSSCNLVLANDIVTRLNMIITPEEAKYSVSVKRKEVLRDLVEMIKLRSQLTFTHSTVVDGELVKWDSSEVYPSLREVVNHCINSNAYKPFAGATVGHFACKIGETEFLTSVRKSNFNDLEKNGLVRIKTDGPDKIIAYGAKPSVGGQSQRIIFSDHKDYDCIVHFHCPLKPNHKDAINVISQKEYECGSHECGKNTSNGLTKFGNLSAVMLDNHGPNIVFHHTIDPKEVIEFIENNFDLSDKTGGLL